MRNSGLFLSVAFVCSSSLVGCGEKSLPATIEKTVPASGIVTYQGKPLENYLVAFRPKDSKRPATGRTDADGRFKLGTNKVGDGAAPGQHQVSVSYVGPEVNPVPGQEFQEVPPAKVVIPEKFGAPETSEIVQEIPAGGSTDLKIDLK